MKRTIEESMEAINAHGWSLTARRATSTEITKSGFGSIMTAGGSEAQRLSTLVDNLLVSERRAAK